MPTLSPRLAVKRALELTLTASGAASLCRRRMSGRVLVLAYHNIVPDGARSFGDLANHLPLSLFSEQLSELRRTHDVIPLAESLTPPRIRSGRPRVVITFDDAYQGAMRYGLDELVRQGLPASVFVAPAFIGGRSFWWDSLSRAESGGLEPATREHALQELRGDDSAIRAWALSVGKQLLEVPEFAKAASEDDLVRAASLPGMSLGSHTWSHQNLTRIPPDVLAAELARPLEWLRKRGLSPLRWIAYPYGYFNDAVSRAAMEAGYEAALGITGGWYPEKPSDNYALPRVNIPPGVSRRGFVLRGAGLLCG